MTSDVPAAAVAAVWGMRHPNEALPDWSSHHTLRLEVANIEAELRAARSHLCPHGAVRQPLTARQYEVLTFLREYHDSHGYAPSQQEIADRIGVRSLATVVEHLSNLQRKGYLHRAPMEARGISLTEPAA